MGYRSDVGIAVSREGYNRICKRVDELSERRDTYLLIGMKRKPEFVEEEGDSVVFGWDWVKWYEGMYADVTNVMTALAEIGADDLPYEFCRVGEEYDDIEFYCRNDNEILSLHVCPDTTISVMY